MTRGDHLLPVVASGAPKLGSLKTRSHRQPAHGRRPDRFGVIATNTERKVHGMRTRRSLTEGWRIKQLDNDRLDIALLTQQAAARDEDCLAAEMPAQVHDVLLMHGLISDPCISRNAADSAWVGEKDWAYACRFVSPQKTGSPVMLRFGGLDTLADAYLNGVHIGKFENMYREYASNVSEYLAPPGQGCSSSSPPPFDISVRSSDQRRTFPNTNTSGSVTAISGRIWGHGLTPSRWVSIEISRLTCPIAHGSRMSISELKCLQIWLPRKFGLMWKPTG
jgi:hypothetical protein